MNIKRKIPIWKFWDWISIRRVIYLFLTLIGAGVLLIYSNTCTRYSNTENLTEFTWAIVVDVKPIKYVDLTMEGNKMRLHGFEVTYQYKVDMNEYTGVYYTGNKSIAIRAEEKIGKEVLIKYNPNQPNESSLYLK